jgi:hypothetical protein
LTHVPCGFPVRPLPCRLLRQPRYGLELARVRPLRNILRDALRLPANERTMLSERLAASLDKGGPVIDIVPRTRRTIALTVYPASVAEASSTQPSLIADSALPSSVEHVMPVESGHAWVAIGLPPAFVLIVVPWRPNIGAAR